MSGRHTGLVVAALVTLSRANVASAHLCDSSTGGGFTGPLMVATQEGELGLARRVCPRTELALAADVTATIDTDHFYGQIRSPLKLTGSIALGKDPRGEIFVSLEVLRYQQVIESITASAIGLGHLSLGGTYVFWARERIALSVTGRFVLPTATGLYRYARPLGFDAGIAAEGRPSASLRLNGQVGLLSSAAISAGESQPRVGFKAVLGGSWQPRRWFVLALEVQATLGYASILDMLAAGLGLRFGGQHIGVSLEVIARLAGHDRSRAGAALRAGWRF